MLNTGDFYYLKTDMLRFKTPKYYSQPDNYSQVFIAITKALINMKNYCYHNFRKSKLHLYKHN
jgi:hypothetical protein